MPDLPRRKVGIVACSGEELAEGTVTRLAALRVLEQLRPADTVTICLPLFLAGGEGDRAFARFYPTIALDGCHLRCAARATERYSAPPVVSLLVSEIAAEEGLGPIEGLRRPNPAGQAACEATAARLAAKVDEILARPWNRRAGAFVESPAPSGAEAACACGSGLPALQLTIAGRTLSLAALPLIFAQLREAGRSPDQAAAGELLEAVRVYNDLSAVPEEASRAALLAAYAAFCSQQDRA